MDLRLNGRTALVTGASRGIGAAVAKVLAEEGVHLALCARDADLLGSLARDIREKHGVRVTEIPADLSSPDTPAGVIESAVSGLGGLDILVNCAGATKRGDFFDLTEQDWTDGFALKFFGYVRMTRAAWPHLKASGGVVVNIVGVAARTPAADYTIAGAVNSALLNFSKAMADIGRRDGVRVNCVNPGYIRTDRLTTRLQDLAARAGSRPEDAARDLCEKIGVRRFGEPEEIGWITAYLASDLGSYIEGAGIDIDGNWTRGI